MTEVQIVTQVWETFVHMIIIIIIIRAVNFRDLLGSSCENYCPAPTCSLHSLLRRLDASTRDSFNSLRLVAAATKNRGEFECIVPKDCSRYHQ
jgi:hypothetical protein